MHPTSLRGTVRRSPSTWFGGRREEGSVVTPGRRRAAARRQRSSGRLRGLKRPLYTTKRGRRARRSKCPASRRMVLRICRVCQERRRFKLQRCQRRGLELDMGEATRRAKDRLSGTWARSAVAVERRRASFGSCPAEPDRGSCTGRFLGEEHVLENLLARQG